MSLSSVFSSFLTRLAFFIYTDRVERFTKQTGIHSELVRLYWSVQSRFHDGTVQLSVADQTASFSVTTPSEYYRFHDLIGEDRILADLLAELEPDDVFYDIGANVGMYTCFVGQVLPAEQIIAFEPHPTNVRRLRENLNLNGIGADIVDCALSNEEGESELVVDRRDEAGAGRHALAVGEEEKTMTIELITGDTLVAENRIPAPTIIKIDIEGAELSALRGLRESLAESCRLCYVEVHPDRIERYGGTAEEIETFFSELGFHTERIHERKDDEYFLKAQNA